MECPEIRRLLEGYLEGILNEQDKTSVEGHLAICKGCSDELASLGAYFKEVGSLEKVKAPEDFLEKIHERLERRFTFEKIMRALFVPARVKIPLELAAVTATVILAIFIYRSALPPVQVATVYTPRMAAKTPLVRELVSVARKGDLVTGVASVVEKARPLEITLLVMPKEVAINTFTAAPLEEKVQPHKESKVEEALNGVYLARNADALLTKNVYRYKKEEELWDTFLSVRLLVINFEGKIISVGYDREKDLPFSLTAEIPSEHYNALLENLKQFGAVPTKPESIKIREEEKLTLTIKFELPAG